jgi:predicted nucleic acid-binding protein
MAMSPATWLVDKSVLARLARPAVRQVVPPHVHAGRIAITIVTELEVGFSVRSTRGYTTTRRTLLDYLVPILVAKGRAAGPRGAGRARAAGPAPRGQHPDLLVAAGAEVEQLSVLHYGADFELVASITGQPTEWVVPAAASTDPGPATLIASRP